ncbi:MAG: lysophospholipid acyltransferase family protein [Nitrospirota bacterium]
MYILYDLAHIIFFVLFKILFGYRIIGRENVPARGPVILASNHASLLDPSLVGSAIWRRVNFVAKEELFDRRWKRFILLKWKAIPIKRGAMDKTILRTILDRLKAGEPVGLFPEGTRSEGENLLPGKPGIGMVVSMAKVPVVPVYVRGSYKTLGKVHKKFRLTPISVTFGKPIEFGKMEGEAGHERYQRISETIMAAIEKLKNSLSE